MEIKHATKAYEEMNKWKEELTPEQQKKVEQTENSHFWAGVTIGSILTAGLTLLLRK